ncbi:MAG: acetylxylan esterase [Synoicihabitans sp.]
MSSPPLIRIFGIATTLSLIAMTPSSLFGQPAGFNYDESKVPTYTLPDPLADLSGNRISNTRDWEHHRRREVLGLFEKHVYGRTPSADSVAIRFQQQESTRGVLGGLGDRKQIRIHLERAGKRAAIDVLIYLPAGATGAVPLFVGLNFYGNHAAVDDPAVPLNQNWMRPVASAGIVENRATEASRTINTRRWPVADVLSRGYGIATIYCGDIDPDFDDGFKNGIHALFRAGDSPDVDDGEWSTISAWAWGLSRAMDYFETDPFIDHQQVAVVGHSRLGKASLWAGATDERFAIVVSNNSGCGGAALARRRFGETVQRINTNFPHWFNTTHKTYNGREDELPVDQHMLIALMAPRPVYIASATEDRWADPRGEFLAGKHAESVYALYKKEGLGVADQPPPDHPVGGHIGYHLRTGGHDILAYDWEQYMNFADRHFGR